MTTKATPEIPIATPSSRLPLDTSTPKAADSAYNLGLDANSRIVGAGTAFGTACFWHPPLNYRDRLAFRAVFAPSIIGATENLELLNSVMSRLRLLLPATTVQ